MSSARRVLLVTTMCLAIAAYNLWALGGFINGALDPVYAFTSEYAALNQPTSLLFRVSDAVSAGFMVVGATVGLRWFVGPRFTLTTQSMGLPRFAQLDLVFKKWGRRRWWRLVWGLILVFAFATLVDAAFPMTCSPSLTHTHCALPSDIMHETASIVANTATITATLLSALLLRGTRTRAAIATLAVIHTITALYTGIVSLFDATYMMGITQRVSLVALAVWAMLWTYETCVAGTAPHPSVAGRGGVTSG
ncbi:DUF998 domain-containing protein [Gleimia hominis]|uniref:DUF998 domain-containing protein n=1 Tax=Gleimia hominis TaxID=595468 RepID=A0ABU3I998_9ACTO|nr:DUF998 domain-containing protein [Gleimia hominis]MDT3766949.1 DUF998 domain-containing protein [Gleimia hominis]